MKLPLFVIFFKTFQNNIHIIKIIFVIVMEKTRGLIGKKIIKS